jgi:hypothetical protein
MDPTKGNVDMHFEKTAIEVDPVGHYLSQEVSNGIKAGDQSVTGKKIRDAIMFLANGQFDLEREMETPYEGSANVSYYAKTINNCLSYTSRWEKFLDDKETRLQSLAANAPQQVTDQAAPATYDDIRETAPIHEPTFHNANAVATAQQLIANLNNTNLSTTALTSFMDSECRSRTTPPRRRLPRNAYSQCQYRSTSPSPCRWPIQTTKTGQLGLHVYQHAKTLAPKIPQIGRGSEPRA